MTTIRGKHRRSFWLGFGPVVVGLLVLISTLAAPSAFAGTVSVPHYKGLRFADAGQPICVEDRTVGSTLQAKTRDAAYDFNTNTIVSMAYKRGYRACDGYRQRIIVVQGYYGRTGWAGHLAMRGQCSAAVTQNCYRWGQTQAGNWTYVWKDYAVVLLNVSYPHSSSDWDHIITHEVAHAVGLAHRTDICGSVVSQRSGCAWISFLSRGGNSDRYYTNAIYAQ